jgi:glycosyl transferase family 25
MNIIEYFERVRIINMVSRKDRRNETEVNFSRHGFPVNTQEVSFFNAISPAEAKGFPNPGVRGCFLSHMNILEEAKNAKVDKVLVLEDDIQFAKKIVQEGALAVEQLDDLDWDIVYFGHALGDTSDDVRWEKVTEPMLLAHFYAINGKTLERFTQFLKLLLERPPGDPQGGPMHYDGAINTFMQQNEDIKVFYCSKNLGYQRPSKTDLHELSIVDKSIFLRPIMVVYRKIKQRCLRYIR